MSKLAAPNAAFPSGLAQTGDPLLLDLFHRVDMRFNYQFNTQLPHDVKGTIALNTVISALHVLPPDVPADEGGRRSRATRPASPASSISPPRERSSTSSRPTPARSAPTTRSTLQAVVKVTGVVGGKPITETFTPVLPFSFNHQLMKLAVPAAAAPAAGGSDYTATTSGLAAILNPEQAGSITHRVANSVTVLRFHLDVGEAPDLRHRARARSRSRR